DSPNAATIGSVVLTDLGTETHTFDTEQRFLPLSFTKSGTTVMAQAPISAQLAPPGYYLMWLVDQGGVPSVASTIHISGPSQPITPPAVSVIPPVSTRVFGASVQISVVATSSVVMNEVQLDIDGQPVGQPLLATP